MSASPRHAIYWAPEADHPLWKAGCAWLGRDAESGWTAPHPRPHAADPRRYGFHATLKAPMRLRDGVSVHDLFGAVAQLASSTHSFAMPPLEVSTLRGFVALRPVGPIDAAHPLRKLADSSVRELDALRRPLTDDELTRRMQTMDFDAQERANIAGFGYAFAFDRWQFHMTLSDGIAETDNALRDHVLADARRHFADALTVPMLCTALSVFTEESPGSDLRLVRRLPLAA